MTKAASFDYSQAVSPWHSSHDGVGNVLRTAENQTMSGMTDRVVANTYDHCNRLDTEQCDQIGSILDGGEAGARRESHAMPRMANQTITPSGGSAVTTDYGYDLADNRTSKAVGSAVTEYNFGNGNNGANSNQLISYGPAGQTVTHTFSYDNNGNRATRVTSAGTESYTWDDDNRLIALDTPSGDYSYKYDHRTRRIVRDESAASGAVTEVTFSGGTNVQESNTSGTVQVELIRGSDWGGGVGGVLFTIRSGQRSYNAYNSRGDVVSVTNDSGAATWQASYEAFGTRTEEDGTNTERQRANTKEEDPTGLLNEGFRYRDLEAGVFISRDPLGFVDGPNVYAYVRQNPWSAFDPLGLQENFVAPEWQHDIVKSKDNPMNNLATEAGYTNTEINSAKNGTIIDQGPHRIKQQDGLHTTGPQSNRQTWEAAQAEAANKWKTDNPGKKPTKKDVDTLISNLKADPRFAEQYAKGIKADIDYSSWKKVTDKVKYANNLRLIHKAGLLAKYTKKTPYVKYATIGLASASITNQLRAQNYSGAIYDTAGFLPIVGEGQLLIEVGSQGKENLSDDPHKMNNMSDAQWMWGKYSGL